MKKSVDPEKSKQSKEKTVRNRNKRRYKRKKNAKAAKRNFEKSFHQEKCFVRKPSPPATASHLPTTPSVLPALKNAQNVWIKTYQNIVKWQYQHQLSYWKQRALKLREENARLKRRLAVQDSEDEEEEDHEAAAREHQQRQEAVATALDDDDDDGAADEEESLDKEFIAFMEVSARHRLERRRLKNESVH